MVLAEDSRSPRRRWVGRTILVVVLAGIVAAAYLGYRTVVQTVSSPSCQATASGTSFTFTPEQAANAALISAVAVKRGLPPRAATIALATAIQESKLRNLVYGDRDSVGLFQQRPSQGWGTSEQILDPVYSTNKFYDALTKVKDYETREITQVAQAVQRSGYPEAYADHEQEGRVLASTLTGHSPAGFGCQLKPVNQASDGAAVGADLQAQLGVTAKQDGVQLSLVGATAEEAWAAGQWAVARADAYGIERVQVGDRVWERGQGGDAFSWSPAQASAPTAVTVRIGSPTG